MLLLICYTIILKIIKLLIKYVTIYYKKTFVQSLSDTLEPVSLALPYIK